MSTNIDYRAEALELQKKLTPHQIIPGPVGVGLFLNQAHYVKQTLCQRGHRLWQLADAIEVKRTPQTTLLWPIEKECTESYFARSIHESYRQILGDKVVKQLRETAQELYKQALEYQCDKPLQLISGVKSYPDTQDLNELEIH